jgi:TIR domain
MSKNKTVFLSYSPRDASLAERVAAELVKSGVMPLDIHRTLAPGDVRSAIRDAIGRSRALVLVVGSPEAARSGWLAYEMGMFDAVGKQVFVLVSNVHALHDLPADFAQSRVWTFDPGKPEPAVRSVASEILAAA